MAGTAKSRSTTRGSVTGAAGGLHAYVPTKGMFSVELPQRTTVLIVPETAAADEALKKSGYRVFRKAGTGQFIQQTLGANAISATVRDEAYRPGPRARAILRGVDYAEKDLEDAGGAFDVEEVRRLLRGVSRQAIDKRVLEGHLVAVPGPSGRRRFPAVQFRDDGSPLPGLKETQAALGFESPWSVLNFLVNPHDLLDGERPVDLLRRGEAGPVIAAAKQSGRQGA